MDKLISFIFAVLVVISAFSGLYAVFEVDKQYQKHQEEMQVLRDEIKAYKEKPFNITVTWDIPAEHIGADLPPLPVRKGE
jgi:heat shock protein HspQ